MALTRKEFLLVIAGTAVAACGGSSKSSSSANCLQNGTDAEVLNNHGHSLIVTKEDVAAGVAKTYDIRGTADHTHSVTFTPADFAALAANNAAHETSTIDVGHSHGINVICV